MPLITAGAARTLAEKVPALHAVTCAGAHGAQPRFGAVPAVISTLNLDLHRRGVLHDAADDLPVGRAHAHHLSGRGIVEHAALGGNREIRAHGDHLDRLADDHRRSAAQHVGAQRQALRDAHERDRAVGLLRIGDDGLRQAREVAVARQVVGGGKRLACVDLTRGHVVGHVDRDAADHVERPRLRAHAAHAHGRAAPHARARRHERFERGAGREAAREDLRDRDADLARQARRLLLEEGESGGADSFAVFLTRRHRGGLGLRLRGGVHRRGVGGIGVHAHIRVDGGARRVARAHDRAVRVRAGIRGIDPGGIGHRRHIRLHDTRRGLHRHGCDGALRRARGAGRADGHDAGRVVLGGGVAALARAGDRDHAGLLRLGFGARFCVGVREQRRAIGVRLRVGGGIGGLRGLREHRGHLRGVRTGAVAGARDVDLLAGRAGRIALRLRRRNEAQHAEPCRRDGREPVRRRASRVRVGSLRHRRSPSIALTRIAF
ncbi:hypothetical protein PT2222_200112 [Paraburkholderia tropica]